MTSPAQKLFVPGGNLWTPVPRVDLPRHTESSLIAVIQSARQLRTTAETDASLAMRAKMPVRTFQRALRALEEQGVLSRRRRRGRRTITLLFSLASKPARAMTASRLMVEELRAMSYDEYLKTEHWQAKRAVVLARDSACAVCASEESLDVHHRTYERLGEELLEDLITLCRTCHRIFHDNGRLAKPPLGEGNPF